MATRTIYHVVYDSDERHWEVKLQGAQRASFVFETKEKAIEKARALAKNNRPSQVIVHKMDGTFETEWTYGDDPLSSPG